MHCIACKLSRNINSGNDLENLRIWQQQSEQGAHDISQPAMRCHIIMFCYFQILLLPQPTDSIRFKRDKQ